MSSFILIVIILLFIALAYYILTNFFTDINGRLKEVRELIDQGAWPTAKIVLENILAEADDHLEAHYLMGTVCRQTKDTERAVQEFRKCISLGVYTDDISEEAIRNQLLEIFLESQQIGEAIKELQVLRNVNQSEVKYPLALARLLINRGDSSETPWQLLLDATDIDEEQSELPYLKALYLYKRDDWENAKGHFGEAIRRQPEKFEAHYLLGTILLQQAQYKSALQNFDSAQSSLTYRKSALLGAAKCQLQLKEYEKAAAGFEAALRQNRSPAENADMDIEAAYLCGNCHEALGDYLQALNYWDKVLKKAPEYADVREKIKKYSTHRIQDIVVELNTASNADFKLSCEAIVRAMELNILEMIVLKDGNCSVLAKEGKGQRRLAAMHIIRNKDFIDEEDVANIKRFMFENRAKIGIIATTAEVSSKAEELSDENSISFYNHEMLAKFIKKSQQNA